MNNPDTSRQQVLLTHAVLAGLTPLIPIPLLDDLFLGYFWRSLVKQLAVANRKALTAQEIALLGSRPGGGCPLGCVVNLLLYPAKKILRKIFFFLEIKRAADTMSLTYYRGYLLDAALSHEGSTNYHAIDVHTSIERVLARTNTSLVNRAVYGLLRGSRGVGSQLSKHLVRYLPGAGRKPTDGDMQAAAEKLEESETELVQGLVGQLRQAVNSLPAEHFYRLRQELFEELNREQTARLSGSGHGDDAL